MTAVLVKRGILGRDMYHRRPSLKIKGRDQDDAYTSQGTPEISGRNLGFLAEF